jgi:hypothetical protein
VTLGVTRDSSAHSAMSESDLLRGYRGEDGENATPGFCENCGEPAWPGRFCAECWPDPGPVDGQVSLEELLEGAE